MMQFSKFAVASAVLTLLASGCAEDDPQSSGTINDGGTGGTGTAGTGTTAGAAGTGTAAGTGGTGTAGTGTGGTGTAGTAGTGTGATGGTGTAGTGTGATGGTGVEPTQCEQQITNPVFEPAACDTCMKQKCCDALIGCLGDQGCVDLANCMQTNNCQDQACFEENCGDVLTDDAMQRLLNLLGGDACIATTCGAECN